MHPDGPGDGTIRRTRPWRTAEVVLAVVLSALVIAVVLMARAGMSAIDAADGPVGEPAPSVPVRVTPPSAAGAPVPQAMVPPSPSATVSALSEATTGMGRPPPATVVNVPAGPAALLAEREALDRTVWAREVAAQAHEAPFVRLWDAMRARGEDQHELLAAFPLERMTWRAPGAAQTHAHGVEVRMLDGEQRAVDATGWRALVTDLAAEGYRVEHIEFHHSAFDLDAAGTARSTMSTKVFLRHAARSERLVLSGPLAIEWAPSDADAAPRVRAIDASGMRLVLRRGADAFVQAARVAPEDLGAHPERAMDPLLVHDLDRDGDADVLLPSLNVLLRNRSVPGAVRYEREELCSRPLQGVAELDPGRADEVTAGVVADVTGDGRPDLVLAGIALPPTVHVADADGRFSTPPRVACALAAHELRYPICITAGDVDGDGDLDLWLAQYRRPYEGGNLPTPYYDANDSFPSYLLLNRGDGGFEDATAEAGLAAKRTRRTYSASLVDLDADGDLDLLTVNDFSGLDIHRNDGRGRFTDATAESVDERAGFGMSHAMADVDGDGRLDLFMTGMGSTTARRLEHMRLGRPGFEDLQRMRMPMGYGNRLYLGQGGGRFAQAPWNDQVARTGWSWGCTAFDLGNDGTQDLYVANGNLSLTSASDYCSRYWTQDIYVQPGTRPDVLAALFNHEERRLQGMSWNGFEHKALLMNEGGAFLDVAYPMGVGFEWDARAVVGDDVDGDGRTDLLVVRKSHVDGDPNRVRQALVVMRDASAAPGHWIGVRLEDAPGCAVAGAHIEVHAGGRVLPAVVITGDSFRCQHPAAKRFGLGATGEVERIVVRWPRGRTASVDRPVTGRVHRVEAPAR